MDSVFKRIFQDKIIILYSLHVRSENKVQKLLETQTKIDFGRSGSHHGQQHQHQHHGSTRDVRSFAKGDVVLNGVNAFHLCVRYHVPCMVAILASLGPAALPALPDLINTKSASLCQTPLHIAARSGDVKAIR